MQSSCTESANTNGLRYDNKDHPGKDKGYTVMFDNMYEGDQLMVLDTIE